MKAKNMSGGSMDYACYDVERAASMDERPVFDLKRAQEAIRRLVDVMGELELTAAEACHAVKCVDAALKAEYPEAYELMSGNKVCNC